eukprot:7018907-Alexandrium_andersonii.AAC.1
MPHVLKLPVLITAREIMNNMNMLSEPLFAQVLFVLGFVYLVADSQRSRKKFYKLEGTHVVYV